MISKQELNEYIIDRSKSKKDLENEFISRNRINLIHQDEPDFNSPPWLDRYEMFKHLRPRFDQIKFEITPDMSDEDAIPILMKNYDTYLYSIYPFDQTKRVNHLIKFYRSVQRNINSGIKRMTDDKYTSPLGVSEYAWGIIELSRGVDDCVEQLEKEKSKFKDEIFNLYNILLITTTRKKLKKDVDEPKEPRYRTRLENYIQKRKGVKKLNLSELDDMALNRDHLLIQALNDIVYPLRAIKDDQILKWIVRFLNNFENCYYDSLHYHPFFFDPNNGLEEAQKFINVRDVVERSYNVVEAEKALGHRLKKWEIIYNQSKQKFTWAKRAGFTKKHFY